MTYKKFLRTVSALALVSAIVLGSNANVLAAQLPGREVSGGDAGVVSGGDAAVSSGDTGTPGTESPGTQNPGTGNTETGDSGETTPGGKVKLDAPTGLHWDGNWKICWNGVEQAEGYYSVEVWKDGELFSQPSGIWGKGDSVEAMYSPFISESGVYKFRVRSDSDYDAEHYEQSDWSEFSEERTYVRPTEALGTTASLYWDIEKPGILYYNDVDKASGYYISLYREYENENRYVTSQLYVLDDIRFVAGTLNGTGFSGDMNETGRYYATVRALSNNIDEIANGVESDFSPVYDTAVTAATVSSSIADAVKNSSSASEALTRITEENSIYSLRMAMQTDSGVLNQVKSLEEQYMEEKSVTVSKTISTDAGSYVDAARISMVGAGLNADAGNICLDISIPEKKEFVNTNHYSNSVQMDIRLLHDGSPVSDLKMPVTVTMPVPVGLDTARLVVLHYNEDGGFETLNLKDNGDGTVTFTVTHFSTFVFAETGTTQPDKEQNEGSTPPPSTSQNNGRKDTSNTNGQAPKTGETTPYVSWILLLMAVVSGSATLFCRKKDMNSQGRK